eukprot:Skav235779  [mRNA]  locus=scaffold1891:62735:66355:- [translate_table: standard]
MTDSEEAEVLFGLRPLFEETLVEPTGQCLDLDFGPGRGAVEALMGEWQSLCDPTFGKVGRGVVYSPERIAESWEDPGLVAGG